MLVGLVSVEQIDRVDLQALQRQLALLCDVLCVQTADHSAITLHVVSDLGRDDEGVTKLELLERTCMMLVVSALQ